jgi:hypothetical protein
LGVGGGGNTINTTAGSMTWITGTNGVVDTVNSNGDQFGGTTANGRATGIYLDASAQANVNGNGNGIQEAGGDTLGVGGGGNTINTTAGSMTWITGTNGVVDTVNSNGDQFGGTTANGRATGIYLDASAQANVYGNVNGIQEATNDNLGVYGGSNTINTFATDILVLGNTGQYLDTVNANGIAAGGIVLNDSTEANIVGGNNTISAAAGASNVVIEVSGGIRDTVNLNPNSGSTAALNNSSYVTINANGDTVSMGTGNMNENIIGSSDIINAGAGDSFSASNDRINATGSGVSIIGSHDNITLDNTTSVTINGSNNVTVGGTNDAVAEIGDQNNLFLGVNGSGSMSGTDNILVKNLAGGTSELDAFNPKVGISEVIENWSAVNATGTMASAILDLSNGSSQKYLFNPSNGVASEIFFYNGTNGTGTRSQENINYTSNNSDVEIFNPTKDVTLAVESWSAANGIGTNTQNLYNLTAGGSQTQIFSGLPNGITEEISDYSKNNGGGLLVDRTDDFTAGNSQTIFYDPTYGVSQETVHWSGLNDTGSITTADITKYNGDQIIDSYYYNPDNTENHLNEVVQNSSGTTIANENFNSSDQFISGSGGYGYVSVDHGEGAYGFGSGGYSEVESDWGSGGGYGFAGDPSVVTAAVGTDIGVVAQSEIGQENMSAARAAESARQQAYVVSTSAAGTGAAVLEGTKWDQQVVTWSLADNSGNGAAPFSSYMDSSYESAVQDAFKAWAAEAPGVTFEEVSDSPQSDIRIGFGCFHTSTSGVIGYTSYQASGGQMASDAIVRLEDPTEAPLITGSDGEQTYTGTDATLEQVLQHEIGHALGLADNSDVNSIMNYGLTSSNRSLDNTDSYGIGLLYGTAMNASAFSTTSVSQLIQAMATFNTDPGAADTLSMTALMEPSSTILAPSIHMN